jgi:hypothetical protein
MIQQIPFLGIYSKEMKSDGEETCTSIVQALFTITKILSKTSIHQCMKGQKNVK